MSIESYPSPNGVLTSLIWRKTAAGGETSLSGYDNASQALSYTPGQEQVYLNGILLVRGSDYTATNGTSITNLSALSADDFVQVNCYNNFSVASVPTTSLTGTVTNAQLANSTITINGSAISLGGSVSLPGDIESVTAGTGLSGGGSSGSVTLSIDSTVVTLSGTQILTNKTLTDAVQNGSILISPEERTTISATAAATTVNFDADTQGILYYTSNATANWALNVRGSSGTTLASKLAVGDSFSGSFLVTNGSTAYYQTSFTIDGSAVTPKWSGGTAPTSGNTSSIDIYTFTIIKTAATPTYTVFAAGPIKYA